MSNSIKTRDSALNAIKRYMHKSKNDVILESYEHITSYLQLLNEQWARFIEAQDAVELSCGTESIDAEEIVREQAETWYAEALANLSRRKSIFAEASRAVNSSSVVQATPSIPLPKMELPTFAGESVEWIPFHDSFQSLVDANNTLTKVQKLFYLRGCLKGEALSIISNLKICDANYDEAWQLLKARYKVMRVIVESHVRSIVAVSQVSTDSANAIKEVLDPVLQHICSLKALCRPVDFWDDWLVHTVVTKLALETRKQWELSLETDDPPTFEQLKGFLETRCRSLNVFSSASISSTIVSKYSAKALTRKSAAAFHTVNDQNATSESCAYCGACHRIYDCGEFVGLQVDARIKSIKDNGACFNCLSTLHWRNQCRSKSTCRQCNKRHHTLLHQNAPFIQGAGNHEDSSDAANALMATQTSQIGNSGALQIKAGDAVLLATALVSIQDSAGRWQPARILFDTGSQSSFVTNSCVQRLALPRRASSVSITGIGTAQGGRAKGETSLLLSSQSTAKVYNISVLILANITSQLPRCSIPVTSWPHIKDLPLADPDYMVPGPIDVLIGSDTMDQFLCSEIRKGMPGSPMAQKTTFGWVLFGRVSNVKDHGIWTQALYCDAELTTTLSKLWELEESPKRQHLTAEEKFCEESFQLTHRRAPDGRFVVELPFKADVMLGESRNVAVRNLWRMERRFARNEDMRQKYVGFMEELIKLNHMEPVHGITHDSYYMPHHAVLKETSSTTKLRVVFNASSKSSSGWSLNDALMVGPQLQQDLFAILVRFRTHRFALSGDVAKMYRQVIVSPKHTNFQRIVWRSKPTLPIQDYRMLRVTYGVASASHLAVKALQQTAKDSMDNYKHACSIILRDFYMDDLLTGSSNVAELRVLQREISAVLDKGGFTLRQWASNSLELIAELPQSGEGIDHYLAESNDVHALGLIWKTTEDLLTFAINLRKQPEVLSKRAFLSDASTLFDPLGLLSPCTIRSKIWFQDLWKTNVDWDEPVSDQMAARWIAHRDGLKTLAELKVERWLGCGVQGSHMELHVFADASQRAYAAAIYGRTTQPDGSISVALVASKAKVAPLKTTSLPRLELCAAHLAGSLVKAVIGGLGTNEYPIYAWTDSTITLAWLQAHPSRWVTFVANRVADTQETLPPSCWNHVRSENNPADCASRGVAPVELHQHELWWYGPTFLKASEAFWRASARAMYATELEQRPTKIIAHISAAPEHWALYARYSSYAKLKRVTAYMLRFVSNLRSRKIAGDRQVGPLSCKEIQRAELALIRYTQNYYFSNEINSCRMKRHIARRSSLLRLQPFLDHSEILRVGGRLRHANATSDVKNPIIVAKGSPLAALIVTEIHQYTLHAGPQIMRTVLQRRFWILGVRNLLRSVYHNCVRCTLLNRKLAQQSMGDLPASRVIYARSFLCSAVDFAGPFPLKFSHGRGSKSTKGYISSFICMSTGAMHLEFIGDLSTASFLNGFKRFINRRGYCNTVHSDNGTNFVGADAELRKMLERCLADDRVRNFFVNSNIVWKFNPPAAPHMGGYWEIGVKRVKHHLKRVIDSTLLSYEEFSTVLTEIEACVNSGPLCASETDAGELETLTPGHFLVGEPLRAIPEPEAQDFKGNLHQRWHAISSMRRHFWRRWCDEYLTSLQRRTKWFRSSPKLQVDDVVAVLNEGTPPTKWKLGRVLKCHPGSDGHVRVVTLKTSDGELVRPVVKLCLLPTKEQALF